MKKMITKMMGILMAIAMIISLVPGLTQVAHAAGGYNVNLDDMFYGSVTRDKETADEGETVTLTPVPVSGYVLDSLRVYNLTAHEDVPTSESGDNYTFVMPASDVYVMAEFKESSMPATYMITVTNGKAYSDEACTTEVTSASEGTRIYFKTDTPPAGKFAITGVFPSTVEISYIYDVSSFLMPGEDVAINTLFADQIPYTVDLTTNTADGSKVVSEMRMACEQGVVSSPDHTASVYKIDLDNNGDLDISFNQAYTKEMTVLESTNLHGDYTITVAEAMYSPITFKFPDTTPVTEYPVWVGGTQVTSANKDDILGDGTASYTPGEGSGTLTLNNPSITGLHNNAEIYFDGIDLTITGTAKLTNSAADYSIYGGSSADYTGKLTISGANLELAVGIRAEGIKGYYPGVVIDSSTVVVPSIWVQRGGMAIYGSTVSGESLASSNYGATLDITDSEVTFSRGIYYINIIVNSGTVTGGSDSTTEGYGVHAADTIEVNGGTLEGEGVLSGINANNGITMADTHEVILPSGGVLNSATTDVCESDGTTIAKHAKIAPKTTVTTYPVWVGDTQVTSANKDDILGDGGKAKFDPDTNTLTLNDPTVTGSHADGIICYEPSSSDPELLKITGSVTLGDGSTFAGILGIESAIELNGTFDVTGTECGVEAFDVTISGGTVTAHGGVSGIATYKDITITGGTVDATGDTKYGIGSDTKSITISGGTVTATGQEAGIKAGDAINITNANVIATASAEPESYGIYAENNITLSNSTITATAGDGIGATGIYSKAGDITISGGTVTVTAGAGGIYAYDGEVKIENGTAKVEATVGTVAVRGKNGITIGDELMIKLPEGGTVESNSGSYDIMDGSSVARHALIVPKEATTYTVTFDVNGHGTAPAAQTVDDGKTATKPANPNETGWTFGGWYKEAACTNAYDFSTPVTANITLYAKWTEESVTPGVITYTVVSGGDSTWTKDSTSTITITVKRSEADDTCFSHFTGVQIDGTALAASDYEAKAGSTVITLKAATLQKLSTGSHTVTVIFDDGKAETSVTVKAAASPADSKSPKTGDNNYLDLWIVLVIISAIWLGTAVLIRKKHHYISKH